MENGDCLEDSSSLLVMLQNDNNVQYVSGDGDLPDVYPVKILIFLGAKKIVYNVIFVSFYKQDISF